MTRSNPTDGPRPLQDQPLSTTHPSSPEGKRREQAEERTADSGAEPAPLAESPPESVPVSSFLERRPPPSVPSVGRYDLTRQIGLGGMGTVYEGVHRDLRKRAAIKILHAQLAEVRGVRSRFLREGQAASRVRHPNVVDVYDVGLDRDVPYLVMELLEGENLGALLRREHVLGPERAVDIMLPVVAALAAAHDLGVVHRDLKPENVFLCRERGGLRPKVLDFGISKIIDVEAAARLTGTEAFLGTPFYMSPEQAQNVGSIDARADQYSIGVLLYELLTGRRPFEASTLYALLSAIVAGRYEPIRSLNPDVPEALAAVSARAMATRADDRFADARALGAELLPFASARVRLLYEQEITEPELVRPPSGGAGSFLSDGLYALRPAAATVDLETTPAKVRARGRWLLLAAAAGALPVVAIAVVLAWRPAGAPSPVAASAPPAPEASASAAATVVVEPAESAVAPETAPSPGRGAQGAVASPVPSEHSSVPARPASSPAASVPMPPGLAPL